MNMDQMAWRVKMGNHGNGKIQRGSTYDAAIQALKDEWQNVPPSWNGPDPCGDRWEGIGCVNSRVTSITLPSMSLKGQLSGDVQKLAELQILNLSYNKDLTGPLPSVIGNLKKLTNLILVGCGFSGPIPNSIGSLEKLVFLSLNSNNFIGPIPPSIGALSNLYWLDLADNKLSGSIPTSTGNTPGLDMLLHAKHFHFGQNQLSGEIPSQLFSSNMTLIHLLLENNSLIGSVPSTLGLVTTLEVVRLDRNSLSGQVPPLNNLTHVNELFLSNNRFTGTLPDLTGMNVLNYADMSNNSYNASNFPPWLSGLQSLTTLVMENTGLQGEVPAAFFDLSQLQNVNLRNNRLNGTLTVGTGIINQLQLVDMRNNFIDSFTQRPGLTTQIILVNNPFCQQGGEEKVCSLPEQPNSTFSTPSNCASLQCKPDQTFSPTCNCGYPYSGTLNFRAPSFSDLRNSTIYTSLQDSMMKSFTSHQLPVDSVSLSDPTRNLQDYLAIRLQIFPSGQDYFNRTGITGIGFALSNQTFKPPKEFGPYYFIADTYGYFSGAATTSHKKSSSTGIIIGAAVGGTVLLIISVLVGVYAFRQKKRAETADRKNDPFASWDATKNSGDVPQVRGARSFSFEELRKYTNNFSEGNDIGSGGYGKVYRGILPNGQLVAIKRALQGSMQGALEFKTEIELLSRVHHKNVVALVGFCFDRGEQMLVYEYIPNGTLKESLSGKSGIRIDWLRRIRIALGAAKGLQYLHDLVSPPIIHRDIKSNNILLDDRLNAKVADFGLSKPVGSPDRTHITTQVKGTMGYLDPEYYMTQQLTEKSDVYSFGVVMLELVTARSPIENGKYIVREVKQAMDRSKDMYSLHGIIDSAICSSISSRSLERSLERFMDLALICVEEAGVNRPSMREVVKEIENIMELVGLNPNADSASTSASYEEANKSVYPYSDESLFVYSGAFPQAKVEPK